MDLVTIRMELLGARETAAEADTASAAIAGTGTAAGSASAASVAAAKGHDRPRSSLAALGRTAKYAAFGLGGGLVFETVRSINAYREARKVGLQTNQVIKSTGGAANVSARQVGALAGALSLRTGIDDEEIQKVSNLLLTFKNIRNEAGKNNKIFDQATQTALDMSAAYGQDLRSSAIQLGKALQDPVTGASALKRVGAVSQSDIDALTKLGEGGASILSLQKRLLTGINTAGAAGQARKQNDAIDRFGVAVEDLEEKLGRQLFPTVVSITHGLTDFFRGIKNGTGFGGDLASAFNDIKDAVTPLGPLFENVLLPLAGGFLKGVIGTVKTFARILGWIGEKAEPLKPLFAGLGTVLSLFVGGPISKALGAVGKFSRVLGWLVAPFRLIFSIVGKVGARLSTFGKFVAGGLVQLVTGGWDSITGALKSGARGVGDFISGAFDTVKSGVVTVINFVIDRINDLIWAHNKLPFVGDITPIPNIGGSAIDPGSAGAGVAGFSNAVGAHGGGKPRPSSTPAPTPRPSPFSRPIVLQVNLDGKRVAENTYRHAETAAARI